MNSVESLLDDLRPEIRGLDTVRVSKANLLKALEENKAEHRQIFEEAIDKWHDEVKLKLARMVEQAKLGPDAVELMVGLPRPDDHTKDYTSVIRLVTMSEDEEFELTYRDFQMYVMDEWGWQAAFLASTSAYSGTARGKFKRMSQ